MQKTIAPTWQQDFKNQTQHTQLVIWQTVPKSADQYEKIHSKPKQRHSSKHIWITGHLTTAWLSNVEFQSVGCEILPRLLWEQTGCEESAGRLVSFTTLDIKVCGQWRRYLQGVCAQTAAGAAARRLKLLVVSAWQSLDHVAGWEMGNELFWAKSQEQSGF